MRRKEAEFQDAEQIRELERVVLLKVIDNKWMSISMTWTSCVRVSACSLRPERSGCEYKMNAYEMFEP